MELLSESAALYSDGGGKASAVPNVLEGAEAVARVLINIARLRAGKGAFYETRPTSFNGTPGMLVYTEGQPVTALSLEIVDGRIEKIFAHRNPDKLRRFS
jgi:RNA polymerase sigma-70 factor (ECF subfamily)